MASTTVKLDCEAIGIKGQVFTLAHAADLFQYQHEKRLTDWQLSPGQPYEEKNGAIIHTGNGKDKKAAE